MMQSKDKTLIIVCGALRRAQEITSTHSAMHPGSSIVRFLPVAALPLSGNTQKYGQTAVNFLHDGIAGLTDVRAQLFAGNGYRFIHHHLRLYG